MAYRVETHKALGNYKWVNDWTISAPSQSAAQDTAIAIMNWERTMLHNVVLLDSARVSTLATGDRVYTHLGYNQYGTYEYTNGELLPLFNTLRLDLEATWATPGRKFLRGLLDEELVSFDKLRADKLPTIQTLVSGLLTAIAAVGTSLVSPRTLVPWIGIQVYPNVQMRDLHRHRRPKTIAPHA